MIFAARSCRLWLGLLPGLCVHAMHSTAVFIAFSLSLPLSVIHAFVSPESRRTEPCHCLCRTAGIFLAQERSQQELHAAVKRCFAVVNSSISEGMSAAILEVNICRTLTHLFIAHALGCRIIVNIGNCIHILVNV